MLKLHFSYGRHPAANLMDVVIKTIFVSVLIKLTGQHCNAIFGIEVTLPAKHIEGATPATRALRFWQYSGDDRASYTCCIIGCTYNGESLLYVFSVDVFYNEIVACVFKISPKVQGQKEMFV